MTGRWSVWTWIALGLLVAVQVAVTFVLAIGIHLDTQESCNAPALPSELARAQRDLSVLAVVSLLPWLVPAVWQRSGRVAILGTCASVVAVGFAIEAWTATPETWTGWSFCF